MPNSNSAGAISGTPFAQRLPRGPYAVSPEQVADKRDCFAATYEIAQERLLGVLTYQCYRRADLADRVGSAIEAGLDLLASDPLLTRLIVIEAPAVGGPVAARHHDWLDRYGRLLRFAAIGNPVGAAPGKAVEPAVIGGLLSRVKQLVLAGRINQLPGLCPELVQFTLSFYGSSVATSPPLQPQSPDDASVLEPA